MGDAGPFVRVGGVGHVFAFPVFRVDGLAELVGGDAPGVAGQVGFNGGFFSPVNNVGDHGAGYEIPVVQGFHFPGDQGEFHIGPVRIHVFAGRLDELVDAVCRGHGLVQVAGEDFFGVVFRGAAHPDFHIQPAGPQHSRVDKFFPVGGPNNNNVGEGFHPIEFGEELGHHGGFHVGGHPGAAGAEN